MVGGERERGVCCFVLKSSGRLSVDLQGSQFLLKEFLQMGEEISLNDIKFLQMTTFIYIICRLYISTSTICLEIVQNKPFNIIMGCTTIDREYEN